MKLFKKLSLDNNLINQLQIATQREMAGLNLSSAQIHFLSEPVYIFNSYLALRQIRPLVRSCILFHRPGNFPQTLHIDCNNDDPPQLMNCAVNIPILNCEDSYMEWYSGEYTTDVNSQVGPDGKTRKFIELNWQGQPEILTRTIIDQPTLVRVNQPHKVTVTDRTRSLITLRFFNNPTFEAIASLID